MKLTWLQQKVLIVLKDAQAWCERVDAHYDGWTVAQVRATICQRWPQKTGKPTVSRQAVQAAIRGMLTDVICDDETRAPLLYRVRRPDERHLHLVQPLNLDPPRRWATS